MKRTIHLAILLALFLTTPAWAYKEQIHRVFSLKAFDRMTATLKPHLGVDATVNLSGDSPRVLVGQGAYDEDDFPNSLNHFYDPVHEAPLSVPVDACIPNGATAKNWAVGGLGNTYTTINARQFYESVLMAPNQAVRDNNLRLLFLALGHSIHLVQDMAQPEHVRNDQHLTLAGVEFGYPVGSLYEEWGIANLLGANPVVPYDGYPNVNLPVAFDYFGSAMNKGLAQFTNSSFVTQDTNYDDEQDFFHCHYYTLPRITDAVERVEVVDEAVADAFGGVTIMPIQERIYTSYPMDPYTGQTETDPDHTFLSSLDLETRFLTGIPKYSLADASFQTRAGLLVPRAVGYSAGYLDHFFRGSISVDWTRNDSTGLYNIKITNTSSEPLGTDAIVRAVYVPGADYTGFGGGNDIAVILNGPLTSYAPGFNGLAPGASTTIPAFNIPFLKPQDNVKKFERRVVIRGTLGDEPNDVIGLVQQPSASGTLVVDMTISNCPSAFDRFAVITPPTQKSQVTDFVHLLPGETQMCADPQNPDHTKNACIERLPAPARGARLTISPYDDRTKTQILHIGAWESADIGPACTYNWVVKVDGAVVATHQWVNTSTEPIWGSFQDFTYTPTP